jgi:prepilin-type processing-associated H-X9-DG protein
MSLNKLTITGALALTAGTLVLGTALRAMCEQGAPGQVQKAESQEQDPAQKAKAAAKKAAEVREARAKSENNLKQIALAMHNIASLSNPPRFPGAAIRDKDGKPLLSWRVAVLPYLEQQALYEKFHLDEAWDSPHNKALLKEIPDVYVPVIRSDEPKISTYYQVITGPGALFESKEGPSILDITDGTVNTLMVMEAGSPVPWTKPEDVTYDKEKPVPKLGRLFRGGFNAAFADGSVHFLSAAIREQVMRAVITRNGGEIIDQKALEVDEKPAEE